MLLQDPGSDYGRQKRGCRELMKAFARDHGGDTLRKALAQCNELLMNLEHVIADDDVRADIDKILKVGCWPFTPCQCAHSKRPHGRRTLGGSSAACAPPMI